MPRDHYLPAAFLGRFTGDSNPNFRKRKLWVLRRGQAAPFNTAAENVGGINDLYTLQDSPYGPDFVDKVWQPYERRLVAALDELANPYPSSVDGETWLRVLVPFVAGIFVRGPDFTRRFESNPVVSGAAEAFGQDAKWMRNNTNVARVMAFQWLLSPIMAAQWTVMHCHGRVPVIVSDLGYGNHSLHPSLPPGWAIPIDRQTVLTITPLGDGYGRKVLFDAGNGEWRALIEHVHLSPDEHVGLNNVLAAGASEFIAGEIRAAVDAYHATMQQPQPDQGAASLDSLPSHRMQIVHDKEWYRLASVIRLPATDERVREFKIDWEAIGKAWYPPVVLTLNRPMFGTGLRQRGRSIDLCLTEVPGYTDYSPGPFPWETEERADGPPPV
jgi:hypothetical protein